jgi:uncharacterized protein (TIGR02646 family)
MLKVKRTPLPSDLEKLLAQRQKKANSSTESPKEVWGNFYGATLYDKFKLHLHQVFNKKCAYCEFNEPTDIEHFWQKSSHKDRMFAWENLFSSCSMCNKLKIGEMELNADGHPKLLNPCTEDPFKFFNIIIDVQDTKLGWIDPRLGLLPSDEEKAIYTIELFNLNQRSRILRARKRTTEDFLSLLEGLKKYGAEFELPVGKSLRERFLDFMDAEEPCMAPVRQILIDNPGFHQFLLQEIPELEPVLEKWFLPLEH